ncbi:MAG: hypothetical protein ACREPB_07800 [Arenimonas sp.]
MDRLSLAIFLVDLAWTEYEQCCADVWREFERIDPALAREVERLGLTEEGTAEWVCPSPYEGQSSPAELLVEGKRDKILRKIEGVLHAPDLTS